MPTEEHAIVLDYLPEGRADSPTPGYKREKQIAQVVGEDYFSLLEVVIRPDFATQAGERIYIGKGVRDKVHHIKRRVNYDELTSTARVELDYTLEKLVKAQEDKFVRWFNECGPLTTRLHRLELLPGVGKKHMWDINKIRMAKKFESFANIAERVKLLPDPEKLIIKRIIWELRGEDDKGKQIKYRIFVGVPLFPGEEKKPASNEPKPAEKAAQ
jgi:putative nucleotide binding protein